MQMAIIVMLKTMMMAQLVTTLTSALIQQHVTMEPNVQILLEVFHVHMGQDLLTVISKTIHV